MTTDRRYPTTRHPPLRLHWPRPGEGMTLAYCGQDRLRFADTPAAVTCGWCRRAAARKEGRHEAE